MVIDFKKEILLKYGYTPAILYGVYKANPGITTAGIKAGTGWCDSTIYSATKVLEIEGYIKTNWVLNDRNKWCRKGAVILK